MHGAAIKVIFHRCLEIECRIGCDWKFMNEDWNKK
jgi:hypothetical protein